MWKKIICCFLNHCAKWGTLTTIPTREQPQHFPTAQWGYFDLPKTRAPVQVVTAPLDTFVSSDRGLKHLAGTETHSPLVTVADRSWMIWIWGGNTNQCPSPLILIQQGDKEVMTLLLMWIPRKEVNKFASTLSRPLLIYTNTGQLN